MLGPPSQNLKVFLKLPQQVQINSVQSMKCHYLRKSSEIIDFAETLM